MALNITIDGNPMSVDDVRANRENLIELRNTALAQAEMEWAVILSHSIAILAAVVDELKQVPSPEEQAFQDMVNETAAQAAREAQEN